jgi:hypothetical protein
MPLPSTYMKVTLLFRNPDTGSRATCVLWYLPTSSIGTVTNANIVTFANDFKTAFASAVAGALGAPAQCLNVTAKWVSAGNEFEGQNTNGTINGAVSGDILPEEDVICIQRRTGKQGRTKRGRIFFPYVSESFQEDGELNDAGIAGATALATMVKNLVTANSVQFTPKTLDHKNGVLETVTQAGFPTNTCSRRDRRSPKQMVSIRVN